MKNWLCWGVLAVAAVTIRAAEKEIDGKARDSEARIKHDLEFLASDECEGRGPTTKGINKAADFIAGEFKKAGLKPAGQAGTYFQYFSIPGARLTAPATLSFSGPKSQTIEPKGAVADSTKGAEFNALGLSYSGAVKDAGLVFVGFGVNSKDFNEWADLEVAGKVVVVLRDAPKFIEARNRRQAASLVEKMTQAEKRDALAILFVNDADTAKDGDDLLDFNFLATARNTIKLPAYHVKRAVVDKILAAAGMKDLAKLEANIQEDKKQQSAAVKGWTTSCEVNVKRDGIELKNVIGVLEGKGPKANETIVIGAHYDHLGYGGTSSLAGLKKMAIHYGADDNASGSSSVLELARRFGAMKDRQGRRLVFMTFSGEELGLLGSAHYCKNPIFPLADTVAMINLDMVGRLKKDPKTGMDQMEVHGVGTAKNFEQVLDDANKKYNFELNKKKQGFGPSDHSSFYTVKVPVYFFFTGDHPQYHRPTDKANLINFPGMKKVVDLVEDLAGSIAKSEERPEYVKIAGGASFGPRPSVRLGIRPAYSDEGTGVLIEGVTDGEPAARAGIKQGDRIIEMGGKKIKNLEGYMLFMKDQKKGDTVELKVMRMDKEMKLSVKLE
jgi:hypothetical protein